MGRARSACYRRDMTGLLLLGLLSQLGPLSFKQMIARTGLTYGGVRSAMERLRHLGSVEYTRQPGTFRHRPPVTYRRIPRRETA